MWASLKAFLFLLMLIGLCVMVTWSASVGPSGPKFIIPSSICADSTHAVGWNGTAYVCQTIVGQPANLAPYTGGVGLTGNAGNGTDFINAVNWDNITDVRSYGAVCNGVTDDTGAFNNALKNSSRIILPENTTCVIASSLTISAKTGLTIEGGGKFETSPSSTSSKPGLIFTGTPQSCVAGGGGLGLLNITNSYSIIFRGLGLKFTQPATGNNPAFCDIEIFNSSRFKFDDVQITTTNADQSIANQYAGTGAIHTTAVQLEQSDEWTFDNVFFDTGFTRNIYSPPIGTNFLNVGRISHVRIAAPAIVDEYLPLIDFENVAGHPPQNIRIDNTVIEQSPNAIKFGGGGGGFGNEISTNYIADGYGVANSWQASHIFGPAPFIGATSGCGCIIQSVNSSNFEMCPTTQTLITGTCTSPTSGGCTTGSSPPAWTTTPGATYNDGTCVWVNEGNAIAVELNMISGSLHDNLISTGNLVAVKLDTGSAGINVYGNSIGAGYRDGLEDFGDGSKIGTNTIGTNAVHPISTAFVRVGIASACTGPGTSISSQNEKDASGNNICTSLGVCDTTKTGCIADGNQVDTQVYTGTNGAVPYLLLSANTSGWANYNTSTGGLPANLLTNNSPGSWSIIDPGNKVTISPNATYYAGSGGTAIPACIALLARYTACVTDGVTGCTHSTAYAAGAGSASCQVQCNNAGLAWDYTGSYCN